jgi:hypothetical protein
MDTVSMAEINKILGLYVCCQLSFRPYSAGKISADACVIFGMRLMTASTGVGTVTQNHVLLLSRTETQSYSLGQLLTKLSQPLSIKEELRLSLF